MSISPEQLDATATDNGASLPPPTDYGMSPTSPTAEEINLADMSLVIQVENNPQEPHISPAPGERISYYHRICVRTRIGYYIKWTIFAIFAITIIGSFALLIIFQNMTVLKVMNENVITLSFESKEDVFRLLMTNLTQLC